MKFKNLLLIVVYFLLVIPSGIPQRKDLSLDEIILYPSSFLPEPLGQLQWIGDSDFFSYNLHGTLFIKSAENEEVQKISLTELNNSLNANKIIAVPLFPEIEWIDRYSFRFLNANHLLKYEIKNNRISILNSVSDSAANIDPSVSNNAAYTIENNLFVSINNEQIQITHDKNKGIVNGQSVHRNEFGIKKGTFWSPKGNFLAFYRMDETMVTDYPMVDISFRPAKLKMIKYPIAGMTSHEVAVGVFNINTRKTVWLKTGGPKDQYLTNVTWSSDEKYICIAHLNRDQNHMKLIQYDPASGNQLKTLFEEKDDQYVEPEHGPIFFKSDPGKFIWFSERDGWNHLYLYKTNGELIRQLTKGEWEVTEFNGFDSEGEKIFFTATKESPAERHFYQLSINSLELKKISEEPGTHAVYTNKKGKYFLDEFNSLLIPYQVSVLKASSENKKIYSPGDPLENYNTGTTKIFTIKGAYDFYCMMITPPDFDSTGKYPAIMYVYGGPHEQLVTNTWLSGAGLWLNYMASKGYIVFSMDNRGSPYRGLEFEQSTFRKLGDFEIEDQKIGAEYLKSLPYVDSERLGIYGWSYGGFMTTSLMTRTPDLFKAGVSGGTVIDWKYYEVMYTERYMDTPESNQEGYEKSSLLNYADRLRGNLLMVHVTSDPVVLWQNSLLFVKKAVELGIPLDYFPYPGETHGVTGRDKYHLYRKITDYFNLHLKNLFNN